MSEKPNRWLRVVGALLMNLSLGSLYAWSIFVAPLEKEFGWNRAQTSWIFTVAIFMFGVAFVVQCCRQSVSGLFIKTERSDTLRRLRSLNAES